MLRCRLLLGIVLLILNITLIAAVTPLKPAINPPQIKPRVLLVLGSGGARGYAHLGVLQALQQAHIPIDAITCASSGCIIGALFADNNSATQTAKIMLHASFWDFADILNLPHLNGIVLGTHLERFLLENMHAKNFDQLRIPLVIAATDLNTGNEITLASGSIASAVLASTALPGIVKPKLLYGHELLDGGISDPIPVDLAKKLHPTIIIAVNVASELPVQIPKLSISIYRRANTMIWSHYSEQSTRGADIVIHPNLGMIGTFDLSKKEQMILAGYTATQKVIPEIQKLLHEKRSIPITP